MQFMGSVGTKKPFHTRVPPGGMVNEPALLSAGADPNAQAIEADVLSSSIARSARRLGAAGAAWAEDVPTLVAMIVMLPEEGLTIAPAREMHGIKRMPAINTKNVFIGRLPFWR